MAVNLNLWVSKFPDVERQVLIRWITEASVKGLNNDRLEAYLVDKHDIFKARGPVKDNLMAAFRAKWNIDPVTGFNVQKDVQKDVQKEPGIPEKEPEVIPLPPVEKEEGEDDEQMEELDYEEEDYGEDEGLPDEEKPELLEVPDGDSPGEGFDDGVPYVNPDLEALQKKPEMVPPSRPLPNLLAMRALRNYDEFVSKKVSQEEFDAALKPFKPFFNIARENKDMLIQFAERMDVNNHPPLMNMSNIIFNNPIKDPSKTSILMSTVDEERPDKTVQKYIALPEARQVCRNLAEQGFFQDAINDYDVLADQLDKDRQAMAALIYILEVYLQAKDKSPFEFQIPKQYLTQTILEAFDGIKGLIVNQVVVGLGDMRADLKGEMGSVADVVHNSIQGFDKQITKAVEQVIWKVKTDIEQTNLEDIKRTVLYLLNKRASAYHLTGNPVAVITVMVDDLERRMVNEEFKMSDDMKFRRYTVSEMQKRLNYRYPDTITKALLSLRKAKLIILFDDKTFSLAK